MKDVAGADLTPEEVAAAEEALRERLRTNGKLTGCTSYIQRKLQVGYRHAYRIVQHLEAAQFITGHDTTTGERQKGPTWDEQWKALRR